MTFKLTIRAHFLSIQNYTIFYEPEYLRDKFIAFSNFWQLSVTTKHPAYTPFMCLCANLSSHSGSWSDMRKYNVA